MGGRPDFLFFTNLCERLERKTEVQRDCSHQLCVWLQLDRPTSARSSVLSLVCVADDDDDNDDDKENRLPYRLFV